jgi:hypothetical protein
VAAKGRVSIKASKTSKRKLRNLPTTAIQKELITWLKSTLVSQKLFKKTIPDGQLRNAMLKASGPPKTFFAEIAPNHTFLFFLHKQLTFDRHKNRLSSICESIHSIFFFRNRGTFYLCHFIISILCGK